MIRRDELLKKAEWLQEHGYFRGMDIVALVDKLEASENTYRNMGSNSINKGVIGIGDINGQTLAPQDTEAHGRHE